MEEDKLGVKTFRDLGICEKLVEACESLGWKNPTKIQAEAIPHGLNGKDLIALSQTGSGKTGAFVLPILQALLECRQRFFACVLSPTRELAVQIAEQFQALGSGIGIKCVVLVGEEDIMEQYINLARLPHVIVGTPGRLADHLSNTKGFSFSGLKYLVLDEADRLLNEEFEKSIGEILDVVPHERRTYLFSATMTRKVKKLQKVCLRNPVKIEVASKYSTVDTLEQHYCLIPPKYKDCYLVHILVDKYGFSDETCRFSAMVFTQTGDATRFVALFLRNLKLKAISVSGKMTQSKRLEALNQFKEREFNILICTNVASRGLDIPSVDVVINYDIPAHPKDYIHRVGRTARAGRQGVAISLLNQFELKSFLDIENRLGMKFTELPLKEEEVLQQWMDDVTEAKRISRRRINESGWNKGKKRERDDGDADMKK